MNLAVMNPAFEQFCTRLVLTLGHFLWQGAAIGLLAWLAVSLLRGRAERFRYPVLLTLFVLMPTSALLTSMLVSVPEPQSPSSIPKVVSDESTASSREVSFTPVVSGENSGLAIPSPSSSGLATGTARVQPEGSPSDVAALPEVDPAPTTPLSPLPSQPPPQLTRVAESETAPEYGFVFWLSLAYVLGVVLMLLRLALGLRGGSRLRELASPVEQPELLECLARQLKLIGLRSRPVLAWCSQVAVPTVIGVLRPVILLPAGFATRLTTRQLEALLAHELVHIRRWDPAINILQRLIEAAFFFHPAVWILSKQIRNERENCTDDAVVRLGFPSVEYAKALLHAAELAVFGRTPEADLIAVQAGESPSQLTRRVRRLLNSREHEIFALSRPGLFALLLAIVGSAAIAGSGLNEAQRQDQAAGQEEKKEELEKKDDSEQDSEEASAAKENETAAEDKVQAKGEIIEGVLHRSFDLTRSRDKSRPHSRVVFPNGVEFTILGITTFPHKDGDDWWLPTGEKLPGKPVHFVQPEFSGDPQKKRQAVLLKIENVPPWVRATRKWSNEKERGEKPSEERRFLQMWLPGPIAHVVNLDESKAASDLTFEFPGGMWDAEALFEREEPTSKTFRQIPIALGPRGDIAIESPQSVEIDHANKPASFVRVRYQNTATQGRRLIRVVVMNAAGQRIYPTGKSGPPVGRNAQVDFNFPIAARNIQEISIESLGYENAVTFSGLATEPGKAAKPRVKIVAPAVPEPGEFAFSISKRIQSRVSFTDPMVGIRTQREFAELLNRYGPQKADAEFQAAMRRALEEHIDRVWPFVRMRDSFAWDDIHLHQLSRVRNLQWLLFQFAQNQKLTEKEKKNLQLQLDSTRNRIIKAATGDLKKQREKWLAEFDAILADLLSPCFRRPLTVDQHLEFAELVDDLSEPFSVGRLVDAWAQVQFTSSQGGEPISEFELSTLTEPVWRFVRDPKSNRLTASYFSASKQSGIEVPLRSIRLGGAFIELQSGLAGAASGGAQLERIFKEGGEARTAAWFADREAGAFYLNAIDRRLVGVRGTKFLPLATRYWQQTDFIPTSFLARAIERNGVSSWKFVDDSKPATRPSSLPNALVAIRTADGRVSVASVPRRAIQTTIRIRPHNSPTPRSGQIPAAVAQLIVQGEVGEADSEIGQRLVRQIRDRHFDAELTARVEKFLDQLRTGEGAAADFMTPGVSPRTIRSWEWWGEAGAIEVQDQWKRLRKEVAAGHFKLGPGGFGRLNFWPDFGFNVVRSDRRGYFRLIGVDAAGQQWKRVFLLERISTNAPGSQNGWMITGYTQGRMTSEDFLHDSPAHSPEWKAIEKFTATPLQVEAGNFYLDLDSGSRFTQTAEKASAAWIRTSGVDVRFGSRSMTPKSTGVDLLGAISVLPGEQFSRLSPHGALNLLGEAAPGSRSITGRHLIRTRSGGVFILQTRARSDGGMEVRVRELSRQLIASKTTIEGVYSGDNADLPTETDWKKGRHGIEYRIRQEKKLWRLGEHPLLYVDLKSDGTTERLAVSKSQFQHYIDFDGGRYSRSVGGTFHAIPTKGHITLAFVMSPLWQRSPHKDPMPIEPGRHALRIHVRLGTLPLFDNDGNIVRPPGEQFRPEPMPIAPVAIVISDTDVRRDAKVRAENIRRELIGLTEFHSSMKLPFTLQQMIAQHLPESADVLLSHCESDDEEMAKLAATVVVRFLDDLTDQQTVRYLQTGFGHFAEKRDRYPQGIDAAIGLGYRFEFGHEGLPKDRKYKFRTTTRHFLNGEEFGEKPFSYPGPGAASGSVQLKDLAVGEHSVRMATEWEFTRGEKTLMGKFESGELKFEIVSPDTPNDLIATADPKVTKIVKDSLQFRESQTSFERRSRFSLDPRIRERHWRPSTYTVSKDGTGPVYALHTPFWRMNRPLPVDLAFQMKLKVEGTDLEFPCFDVVVLAGERTYTRNVHASRIPLDKLVKNLLKHADKNGFVKVRLVLTPSREVALQNPKVKKYFPGSITSEVLRIRASTSTEVPPDLPLPDPKYQNGDDDKG